MKPTKYAVMILVLLLPFAFTVSGEEAKHAAKPEAEQQHLMGKENRMVAILGADGVQRVEVVGGEYYFDPNYIVVKANKPVELKLQKTSGYVPHNLIVKAPEAGIDFKTDMKKEPVTVKFTPTKVGKYPMVCDKSLLWFKSHKDRGMEGFIEVVE